MVFTPICVPCRREMRCRKNDFMFMDYEGAAIWAGDMYRCESCQREVVVGFAKEPVGYKGDDMFDAYRRYAQFELTREPMTDLAKAIAYIDSPRDYKVPPGSTILGRDGSSNKT